MLDKWDLKEGHDAYAFMERMVSDSEIKKVILICDRAYAEKANGRTGGVGTEAQIISPEIYAKQDQNKFVAIVKERDDAGRACLPAYYTSRIFIDLSDSSTYSENFERLLRWAHDQPLYKKPEIGTKPSFLLGDSSPVLTTSSRFKRAVEAVKHGRDFSSAAVAEYFDTLSGELEKLRIDSREEPFDDTVIKSIESFFPYRNEAVELFLTLARYKDSLETWDLLHRFLEQLIPYMDRPPHVGQHRDWDFDNFKFIIHEIFLHAIACQIRHERFDSASYLMEQEYYVPGRSEYGREEIVSFTAFRQHMKSLVHRNERLGLRRLSLRADLLKERCQGTSIEFRHLMQADFVLFLRDRLHLRKSWWPETLVYADYLHSSAFEIFARSRSSSYFQKVKILLDIDSKDQLQALLETFAQQSQSLPRWEFDTFNPSKLLGFNEIATRP
jgi:hypothetical protein